MNKEVIQKRSDIQMNESNLTVPVFPLSVFLLPEGIMRLRIFEQRYLQMVKIATKENGFVLGLNTQEQKIPTSQWGSWVDIINFDLGEDGVLEIDVKCHSLVEISSIEKDTDNLHFGAVSKISHWSDKFDGTSILQLSASLEKVFEHDAVLSDLYSEKLMTHSNWVLARWLELIPVSLAVKNTFVEQHNFEEAKGFVQSIILK
jgi:Lon protease-like protein